MNYIEFSKEQLVNLSFSKSKEILRCSRTGSFASTTLAGLNTRKYHGLFIVPQENVDGERHLLVSSLNETIIIDNMEFHIGIQQYKNGIVNPKGNKYLQRFVAEPLPTYYFRVGKFNFTKEFLFLDDSDRLIIKYTIEEPFKSAMIRFQPFLAFRQIHRLTFENDTVDHSYQPIDIGMLYCLYPNYTPVCIQCSNDDILHYEHQPTWFHQIEYEEELKRGYEGHEDLFNPGKINVNVNNKELYITIGTEPIDPKNIEPLFRSIVEKRTSRSTFFNCLQNATEQFIVTKNNKSIVLAGYPWFGRWGRDTFIALPGLTLALHKPELCKKVMDSMLDEIKEGLFPNIGGDSQTAAYNSVDAPLWFIHCLQQYTYYTKTQKKIWKEYGEIIKKILYAYRNGSLYNIKMEHNGLIFAGEEGVALTWMDAIVDGVPITPRTGYQVEINGLWYNALKFSLELAELAGDKDFYKEWKELVTKFPAMFKDTFWSKEKGYLADYVYESYKNFQVRPNMLIVAALPYSPISERIKQLIVKKCIEELLTDRGLRTLSPIDPDYKGFYGGSQAERDRAYHQGTCWPWLLMPFADAMITVYQQHAYPFLEKILYNFEPCMKEYGISTIAEIYDGDPPHKPNGAISQAWSVAALLHIRYLLEKNNK